MEKEKKFRSEGDVFFMDYLPDEVFDNLSESERESYRLYRNNHRWIYDGNEKIKKLESHICLFSSRPHFCENNVKSKLEFKLEFKLESKLNCKSESKS